MPNISNKSTLNSITKMFNDEAKSIISDAKTFDQIENWAKSWFNKEGKLPTGYLVNAIQTLQTKETQKVIENFSKTIHRGLADTVAKATDTIGKNLEATISEHRKNLDNRAKQITEVIKKRDLNQTTAEQSVLDYYDKIITRGQGTNEEHEALIKMIEDTEPRDLTQGTISILKEFLGDVKDLDSQLADESGVPTLSKKETETLKQSIKNYLSRQTDDIVKKSKTKEQNKGIFGIVKRAGDAGSRHGKAIKKLFGGSKLEERHEGLIASLVKQFEQDQPDDVDQKDIEKFEGDLRKEVTSKVKAGNGYLKKSDLKDLQNFGKPDITKTVKDETPVAKNDKPIAEEPDETPIAETVAEPIEPVIVDEEETPDMWHQNPVANMPDDSHEFDLKDEKDENVVKEAVVGTHKEVKKLTENMTSWFNWERENAEDLKNQAEYNDKEELPNAKTTTGSMEEIMDSDDNDNNNSVLAWLAAPKIIAGVKTLLSTVMGGVTIGGAMTVGVLAVAGMAAWESYKKLLEHQESAKDSKRQYAKDRGYDFKQFEILDATEQLDVMQGLQLGEEVKSLVNEADRLKGKDGAPDKKGYEEALKAQKDRIKDFQNFYEKMFDDNPQAANMAYNAIAGKLQKDNIVIDKSFMRGADNKQLHTGEEERTEDLKYKAKVQKEKKTAEKKKVVSTKQGTAFVRWLSEKGNQEEFDKLDEDTQEAWYDDVKEGTNTKNFEAWKKQNVEIPTVKPGVKDAIIRDNTITPFDKDDLVAIGTNLDDKTSQSRLAGALSEALKTSLMENQELFNPKSVKEDTLEFFEKIIEPIQNKIAQNKESDKQAMLQQNTVIAPNKQETIIKEVIKPVEPDFVRY